MDQMRYELAATLQSHFGYCSDLDINPLILQDNLDSALPDELDRYLELCFDHARRCFKKEPNHNFQRAVGRIKRSINGPSEYELALAHSRKSY